MTLPDEIKAPFKCPRCSRALKPSLASMARTSAVRCPCGAEIPVAGDARKIVAALEKFERSLKSFGKR